MKSLTVVIVGGGFAAVQFAETLRRKLTPGKCEMSKNKNHPPGVGKALIDASQQS